MMRAALLEEVGESLSLNVYDDIVIAAPRANEVCVKVAYCGVCHSDLNLLNGSFPFYGPTVPGHEASGVVEAVGENVKHLKVGDRVVITSAPPCGECYFCQRKEFSLCQQATGSQLFALPDGQFAFSRNDQPLYQGFGIGAFAERIVVPDNAAIKIDEDVPLELACLLGCALQTGAGAVLNTASVEAGASVLIMGLGGVGLAAVQAACIAGAEKIIVSDPITERRETALALGATHALNPAEDKIRKHCFQMTNNIGMDYVFETAGKAALIEQAVDCIRPGGTAVIVGAPSLDEGITISPVTLFGSLEKKLCGCMLGSCNSPVDIPRFIQYWREGQLDLQAMVSTIRPLEEINQAFDDLVQGKGVRTAIALS